MANLFQAWDEDIQALGAAKASDDQIEARRQQLAEHFKAKAKAAGLSSKKIYETLDQFDAYSRQNTTAQDDQLTPEEQEMAQRVKDGTTRTGAIKEVGKAVKDAGIGALSSLAGWGGAIAQTAADVGENDKSELASQAAQGLYNVRDDLKSNYSEGTKLAQKDFWTPRGLAMGLAENAGQIAGSATVFGLAGKFAKAREFSRGATLLTAGTVGAPLAYSQGYGQGKENSLDEINKTSNAQLWENVKAEAKAYDDAGGTGEVPYLVGMFKEAGGDLNLMKDLMAENAGNRSGIMTVATEPLAMGVGSVMSRGAAAGGTGVMAKFANAMNNQGMSNELARRIAAGASAAEARKAGQIVGTTALRDNAAIASQAGKIAATQMAREGVQETAQEGLEGYYAKGEGSRAAGRKGELNSADWSGENGIVQQGLQGGAIGLLMGAGGSGVTLRNASKLALEKNGLPEKHDAAIIAKEQADAALVQAANIADANPNNIDAQNAYAEAQDAALVATNDLEQLTGKFNALYTPEEQAVIKAATMEGVAARKKVADDAAKAQKELDDAQAKEQADIAAQQAEAIKTQRDEVISRLVPMLGDDVAISNELASLGLSEEDANTLLTDAHKEAKAQKKAQKKAGQQNQSAPKTPFELAVDEAFDANGNRNKAASQDIADKHGIKNIKTLIDAISERIDSNETKNKAAANEALAQKRQKEKEQADVLSEKQKLENTLADFAANNDHDSMVNFLRDYEPTEADKLIKNAYASVESKKKAEQDAIAATKKAEALKVKESEAKTQAEQKKIAFNRDMADLYAANPDRNPTKAELDSVGKKHGVKSPIELAQAWVKAKNEAKAAKEAAPKLAFPSPETATKDERDITVPTGMNINRDNIENSDKEPIIVRSNGQPFQTQEAAEQALKNKSTKKPRKNEAPITPETHEVIPVDGGFAIAPVVEIQQPKKPDDNEDGGVIADAPKPNAPVSPTGRQAVSPTGEQVVDTAPTKPVEDDGIKTKNIKQPKPADRTVYPHRDDLLTAIAKMKGLNKAQAIYHGIKDSLELNKRGRGLLGVFKEDGRGFDVIARELSDMGYPVNEGGNTPYDNINGTPTPDALLDALRKALFDEDVGTEEYILNKYAAQREADQKEAEEMERLFNGKGSSSWDEADALDNVSDAIVNDITNVISTVAPEKLSETLKEVSNEPIIEIGGQAPNVKTEARSPQNGDAETAGTGKTGQQESQSSTGQDSGIGLNPSFNLNAQTNEELAKRDADNKASEAKRQAEEKTAKDKAQADKEVSDFRLSGSNAPADIAMAGGQKDMFAPPTRGEREAEKAETKQEQPQDKVIANNETNWIGADKAFSKNIDNDYGPSGAISEAVDFAKSSPKGTTTLETIIRPNGNKWHTLYLSNGKGGLAIKSIGGKQTESLESVVAYLEGEIKKESESAEVFAQNKIKEEISNNKIADEDGFVAGFKLGTIIPNTGRKIRQAFIAKNNNDGTFDVEGLFGNKPVIIKDMSALGIRDALQRYQRTTNSNPNTQANNAPTPKAEATHIEDGKAEDKSANQFGTRGEAIKHWIANNKGVPFEIVESNGLFEAKEPAIDEDNSFDKRSKVSKLFTWWDTGKMTLEDKRALLSKVEAITGYMDNANSSWNSLKDLTRVELTKIYDKEQQEKSAQNNEPAPTKQPETKTEPRRKIDFSEASVKLEDVLNKWEAIKKGDIVVTKSGRALIAQSDAKGKMSIRFKVREGSLEEALSVLNVTGNNKVSKMLSEQLKKDTNDALIKKLIGKTPEGKDLYEDGRGVRFTDNGRGVQLGEDVAITMQNGKTVYDTSNRTDEHRTVEEVAARQPKPPLKATASKSEFNKTFGVDESKIDKIAKDFERKSQDNNEVTGYSDKQPTKKESLLIKIDDELDAALDDLAAIFKDQGNRLSSGVDPVIMGKVLAIGMKASTLYLAKGAVKFSIWAENMIASLSSKGVSQDLVEPYLKGLYAASKMQVSPEIRKQMDKEDDVYDFDFATLNVDQQTKGKANESQGNGSNSTRPLENVLPEGNQPTGEEGDAGQRGNRGGKTNTNGNGRANAGRSNRGGGVAAGQNAMDSERPSQELAEQELAEEAEKVEDKTLPGQPRTPKKLTGVNPGNYRITEADKIGTGTPGERLKQNLEAIRLVRTLQAEGRYATKEEQAVLAKYVGWGGLANAFDEASKQKQYREANAELKRLLSPEEYTEALLSTRNAHYTSPKVIKAMYDLVRHLGFMGGNVLEPTVGSGNFIGLMPEDFAASSNWYAAEIDPITGALAQYLYPEGQVMAGTGFQDAEFAYGKFDLAIGNPPFGDTRITDRNKARQHLTRMKIHNYIISKSGMHLRPGGVMAMVITHRFLDTKNDEARAELAKNFRFVGAIRLPNTAFKENANTEVTTDIVVFQKLKPGEEATTNLEWLDTSATIKSDKGQDIRLNGYFAKHPEMMLGKPTLDGTMYAGARGDEFTLEAIPDMDLEQAIADRIKTNLADQAGTMDNSAEYLEAASAGNMVNRADVGIGGFLFEGGKLSMREADDANGNPVFVVLTPQTKWTEKTELGQKRYDRIIGMLHLRQQTIEMIALEMADAPVKLLDKHRALLNKSYDAFVKEHGFLADPANSKLMDGDIGLEFGLENSYQKALSVARAKATGMKQKPASAKKADILSRRVFTPHKVVTSADTAKDGYLVSLSEHGKLDLPYISELTGKTIKQVTDELSSGENPLIFMNPKTEQWEQHDEYLSGNVKAKHQEAVQAGLEVNAKALEAVFPEDVKPNDLHITVRSSWLPIDHFVQFLDLVGVKNSKVSVNPYTGMMYVSFGEDVPNALSDEFKNDDYTISEMLGNLANGKVLTAYDREPDGNGGYKRVVNKDRTAILSIQSKKMKELFNDWMRLDDNRMQEAAKAFNEKMNTHSAREYNGAKMLVTVGASPSIKLLNTQKNAAWRMIQSPVILLDHVVGAGKTFTLITGIMERRRLGLSRKPAMVVPNHLVGQWAKDFYALYPAAKLLAISEKDFAKSNRQRLFARMATGNFDAIIMGHSSLKFIQVSAATESKMVREEIEYLQKALAVASESEDKRTVKTLANQISKKMERFKALGDIKRDTLVEWEQMGIDYLGIDESHEFKNLEYSTSMQRVTGMNDPKGSQRAFDLYTKIRELRARGGGVAFATGTPISNSLVEMYTILRYLNRDELKARGNDVFDAWVGTYGEVDTRIEYTATQKLKSRNVLARFGNLPELLQLYNEVADTVTMTNLKQIYAEQVREANKRTGETKSEKMPIPPVKDGGRQLDVGDLTAAQNEYMDYLVARAESIEEQGSKNDPKIDNLLWISNDARKMSLDMRLVDPMAQDSPDSKVNRAANNIKRTYDRTNANKGTQLVFCDLSTPKKGADKEGKKIIKAALEKLGLDNDNRFARMMEDEPLQIQWRMIMDRADNIIEDESTEDATRERIEDWLDKLDSDIEGILLTADSGFSVYDALKQTLVDQGIPENEIAFIHDYNSKEQKSELFGLVNDGSIRVLLGSSPKMGAGTNVQKRLVALHHMDAPWRPSDVEQREGRIIRQGNLFATPPSAENPNPLYDPNFEVEIKAYSTNRTFDTVMWQTLQRKASMIEQFRSGEREMVEPNGDAAGYAEFMAQSTGNPAFKRKIEIEGELNGLQAQKRSYMAKQGEARRFLENYEAIKSRVLKSLEGFKDGQIDSATYNGKTYANDYETARLAEESVYEAEFDQWYLDDGKYGQDLIDYLKLSKDEQAATKKPTAPKKPPYPTIASKRMQAKSEWSQMVAKMMEDAEKNGEATAKIYGDKNLTLTKADEELWELEISGVDIAESRTKTPSAGNIETGFMPNTITNTLRRFKMDAEGRIESLEEDKPIAERVLAKPFPDEAKLASMEKEYEVVKDEVDSLAWSESKRRALQVNRYIAGDKERQLTVKGGIDLVKHGNWRVIEKTINTKGKDSVTTWVVVNKGDGAYKGQPTNNFATKQEAIAWAEKEQLENDPEGKPTPTRSTVNKTERMPPIGPQFSRSTGLTTTQIRAILVKHFGEKLIKALEAKGLITIMDSPPSWAKPDADGAYHNGKSYLFASNLTPETVVATLAHELSGHKGFQELMTPTAYDSLMRQFNRLVKQGNAIALAAKARAEAAEVVTPTADTKEAIALAEKQTLQRQQDELLPYLLTLQATLNATRSQQSAVTKVIEQVYRAVKAWLYRTLSAKGYDGLASKLLQPKDITLLAERMIREMGGDLSGKTPNELQERRAMIQGLSFMGAASALGGGITLVDMSMKARDAKKIIDDILTKGKEGITPSKEFLAVIEKMANAKESVAARKRAASIVEGFITKLRGELLENSQLSGKIAINAKNIKTGEAIFIDAKDAHHESKRMFDAMTEQRKKIESQIVLAASMVESITGYKLNDLVIIPKPDSTIELLVGKQLTDGWREFGFVGASTEWQEGIKINVNAQTLIDLASGSSVIRAGAFSLIAHEMTHAIQHQLLPLNTRDSKVLGVDTFIPDGISAMHKAWLSENPDKYSSQEDSANYKAEKEGFDVGYTAAKAMLKKEGLPLRIISERDLENALLTAAQDTTSTVEALDKFNKANYSDDIRFSQLNTPQTQINAVRKKYEGTSQWMKAPNGQPTKLNEMQWLQVRTPNFKAWFGDWENDPKNASQVVDSNGEPLVVYHGTEYGGFTEFGSSGYGAASREKGFWFSNKIRALEYSGKNQEIEIVPVLKSWSDAAYFAKKLDVEFKKAPEDEYDDGIYFIDDDIASTLNQARNILQKAIEDKQPAGIYPVFLSLKTPKTINAKGKLATNINTLVMSNVPKKYDGMMIVDVDDAGRFGDYGYITDNYVAKTSTQIKSAIGNNGEFNQTNPDIRFSRTEQNPRSSSLDNFIAKAIAEKAWLTTEQINLLNSATTFDELIPLLDKVWNQYFEAKKLKNNNSTKTAVGVDNIKSLIRSEVDSGHITKEHGDLALYFAEKNPALFDSLKSFSFQNDAETLSGNAVSGVYNVVDKVIRISRRTNGSQLTIAHEVLHHAEEFLPENIKSSIIKAWQNDLIRAFKSAENGSNRKTMLHAIIHSIAMGDMSAIEKAINSMDGVIPSNTYHLFNPSEYWAENASRLMNNRSKRQDTWIENARSWINGLIQTLKNALGLQNDAAILKGLRMVLSGSQLKEGGKGIDIDHVYNMKMLKLFSYIGKFNHDGANKTKTSNEKYSRQSKNPITEGIKSAANDAKNSLPKPISGKIDHFLAGRRLPSGDMANITAKTELSLYHRTIGTQQNTALQNADFKKVYDMAQRYLQHVAVDAYAALKVAPNLLGKLESWSDLKKDVKKIWPANFIKQKADRAAVASIIFDETLNNELLSDADILKALTRDQRQIYKEARDAIQVSLENTAKSEMVRKLLAAEAINWSTVESLINQDLPVEQFAQTVRDMVESRIGGFKNELEAILDADPKIKEAFKTGNKNKLIPAQKKELKKALTLKAQIETTEEALKSLNDVENRLGTLIEQGYAPLMRFGEYTLTVRDLDGKVKSFFMFESKSEQVRAVNTIVARYGKTVKLETDMISKEEFKQFAGMTPETVALFAKETGMDKDEAYQHYLKHAIPARSAMTRMIKRKGTEGFSDDIQRVVASFVMSNARMSAKNIYAAQIEKSIQAIESGKSVKDQAYVMKENVFNPKENFAQLRNFLFLWNLGGSIFFGLLNMTQPYMQTLPHLSQYVPIKEAFDAIIKGSGIAGSAMKNGTAPKGYEAEYNRAVREGVVDPQNVFMLSGVERGKTGASNSAWGVITHTMGLIAQVTESFNRKAVFIAALEVANKKGAVWLKKKGFNSAYDFAKDTVDQTQGVYDKANRSNWANTSVGAPLMVFKQFSINYVEQMVRMWKKEAASGDEGKKAVFLMLALLASLSGVMGLPFIKDILDVSETTAAFLGNPVNIEREARLALGKDLADPLFNGVLNHFVFNNLGMDIQGRTGMPDLVPWSNALNPTLSAQGRINEFASIAGATGGLIEKGYDATQLIARGNLGTAALTLMPRSITSAFTGGKMAVTDEVMDSKGNKLFDTTWDEGLVKFIDANPKRMADLSRTKSLEWKDKSIQAYMTTNFKQKIIAAMMDNDQAEVQNLMKKVQEWNTSRPKYPVFINLNTLSKNANKKDQTFDARESIPKGMDWMKNERPEM